MQILVTGGAGFIGSNLIQYIISSTQHSIVNVDSLTYAGNLESLKSINSNERYSFENVDISNSQKLSEVYKAYKPDMVFHLAAESHVDRSIEDPEVFLRTNILGTFNMLESSLIHYKTIKLEERSKFRFIHISTDEVYGDLAISDEPFNEKTPYNPSSPYAASKASSDHLVKAWNRTYDFPAIITNCSNNYGPYQFPEKLIPLIILNAINKKPLPIYGNGEQIRDWLFVGDHIDALYKISQEGEIGSSYNIGSKNEIKNIDLVKAICKILDDIIPNESYSYVDLITHVKDRPGHDYRYAINPEKINNEIGWYPKQSFKEGLRRTVEWYLTNKDWCENIQDGSYMDRQGLVID